MSVTQICSGANPPVQLRPVLAGASLPAAYSPTEQEVQVLSEIGWLFSALLKLIEVEPQVHEILRTLSPHTLEVWNQIRGAIIQLNPGIPENEISAEIIISKVIAALQAPPEDQAVNQADIDKLNQCLDLISGAVNATRDGLISAENHPQASALYSGSHNDNRSFRYEIKMILESLNQLLPDEAQLDLSQSRIDWSNLSAVVISQLVEQINGKISAACGNLAEMVPQPSPGPALLSWNLRLTPVYGFLLYGDEEAAVTRGPGLIGSLGLGFNFGDKMQLKVDWEGLLNTADFLQGESFTNSQGRVSARNSYDFGAISFSHIYNDVPYTLQASFLWAENYLRGERQALGGLSAEVSIPSSNPSLDGVFSPFGGVVFGEPSFGFYAGLQAAYNQANWGIGGQVSYGYIDGHQVDVGAAARWSPISFGGAPFNLLFSANMAYQDEGLGLGLGLTIGWGNLRPPLLSWPGMLQDFGGFAWPDQ